MKTKVSSRTVFIAIVAALGGILFGYDTAYAQTGHLYHRYREYFGI